MKFCLEVDLSEHPADWQKSAMIAHHLQCIAKEILDGEKKGKILGGKWEIRKE
ncbi:MAG: hypothetical protein JEZ11_13130 [Desulfobacterales bacterium]|nr:hypothetical protein [Desulfobacterales bacterium]